MLRIKKLDIFVLKSFCMLFMGTFFICLFIFMMQFLWRYVDEMVGKGLEMTVLAQFFFYSALSLVPASLPLAILLAALITFGNFGERFELLAMKAAGISLLKIMRPLIIFICFICCVSFYFQNVIGPKAQTKLWTLLISMKQKSPEVDIPEGVFYDEIDGYNLYVKHKNRKTGMLYDVLIYNFEKGFENAQIIKSDSGRLEMTADKQHLYLHLYSGEQFENLKSQNMNQRNVPYRRETFREKHAIIEFNSDFNMVDAGIMSNQSNSKDMKMLQADMVIWFGNSKGLISLRKDWRMRENKNTYRVGISGVLLEGEEQDKALEETFPGQYRVALSCWRRHLTLLFSDLTYTDVPHAFYEYQWDDNGEWQRLEGKSELVFYDLLPGSYKLKIRRMGEPDSASVLTVDISMPMGYRLLFGGIALMLLVLAAIGYYLVKIRQRATAAETGVGKLLAEDEELEEEKKEKHISLTQEECEQLLVKVRSCMEIQKLYINPDLKIGQLSDKTGVSVYLLSYLFNHYLNSSYYDFVNSYRIEEFNRLLEKGEHTQYTLQALIEKCGFSSRTSFFRYFKKVNGMSPGEYIRKFDERK